jgi:hypothetical protein
MIPGVLVMIMMLLDATKLGFGMDGRHLGYTSNGVFAFWHARFLAYASNTIVNTISRTLGLHLCTYVVSWLA